MTKLVRDTGAGKSIAAWVIMKGKKQVGAIQAHYGNSRVTVNVWDHTTGGALQTGSASGYGYDKLTSALTGLTIGGVKMSNHCGERIKHTKNNSVTADTFGWDINTDHEDRRTVTVFKESFTRKGYQGANWVGNTKKVRNPDYDPDGQVSADNAPYKTLTIENGARGYSDMYRISGLDILREYGMTIIQAI